MKPRTYVFGSICVAALAFSVPVIAQTTPRNSSSPSAISHETASPAASPAKQSARPNSFHGMISGVDQNAKTFTISGKKKSRVFQVTDKTIVTKSGNTAGMKDITENEEASGSYWKNADGTLEAKTVNIGPTSKAKGGIKKTKTSPVPAASPTASAGLKL